MNTRHKAAVTVLLAAAIVPVANTETIYVDATSCDSDCCVANGTPGCDDPECEAIICAIDPFCCDSSWDGLCADQALDLCPVLCLVGSGTAEDPYCSIQIGIDNALNGDEVLVAPGTYFETINFIGKAITLRSSDGADVTTIDAQQGGTVVTCGSGEGANTVLSGFVITGGNFSSGGGMRNQSSSPTVTNCTFTANSASLRGGGMYNVTASSPTVTDCMFSGNTASVGGGMRNENSSSPTVTNCTFSGNTADIGGGMNNNSSSSPTVTNCTFSGNTADIGGGMDNSSGSSPLVTDCTFCDNSPEHIGGQVVLSGQIHMSSFCPIPVCPGDITGDGVVGINDFLDLLAAWGACP